MQPRQPLVSVIIPVYNAAPYLDGCIRSVLSQTFSDFEIIIVDDGSTDASPAIIRKYADELASFTAIRQENSGLSAARNAGIDMARGELITFIDADDTVHPRFLEVLHGMLKRNPDADIAACAHTRSEFPDATSGSPKETITTGIAALKTMLYQNTALLHTAWGKLYRRKLWDGLRFPDGWFEDLHISVDLFPKARFLVFTSEPLYRYRLSEGNFSSRADASRADAVRAALHIHGIASRSYPCLIPAASDRLFSAAYNLTVMLAVHPCQIDDTVPAMCLRIIHHNRRATLLNRHARAKNRIGALLAYLGVPELLHLASRISKKIQQKERNHSSKTVYLPKVINQHTPKPK